ncbi:Low-density lipoprotein receptor-related protein [Trichinella nelsoni]|uniref:Low-density lipoprotein receptor-related protein n=1 Tax=Trichinella nelsoni TaxID=6336 RepID=A0A0V0RKG8_9BILA|nr:Low-density lipoprotein receptor-related protein [Trichinella nelsoni]
MVSLRQSFSKSVDHRCLFTATMRCILFSAVIIASYFMTILQSATVQECNPLTASMILQCVSPLLQLTNGHTSLKMSPFYGQYSEDACLAYAEYKLCISDDMRDRCYDMIAIMESIFDYICQPDVRANISISANCLSKIDQDPYVRKCQQSFVDSLKHIASSNLESLQEHNDLQCAAVQQFSFCSKSKYLNACKQHAWMIKIELIKRAAGLDSDNCEIENDVQLMAKRKMESPQPRCDNNDHCTCPEGYLFNAPHQCMDIDECALSVTLCSQKCENTVGSYKCHCDSRYFEPSDDGHSCIIKDKNAWIFFAHGQSLWNISLDGKNFQLLRGGIQKAAMLDVDVENEMLYYVDVGADKLERIKFHGAFPQTIQDGGLAGTEGIGVDWIGKKLYMAKTSDLLVQELDGRYRMILYQNVFKLPRALVVHPIEGYVYNSDWGVHAFISKAAMDGSNFKRIVTTGLAWPNGLAIDYYADRLYWADAFLDTIESTDLEGNFRRVVLKDTNSIPHVFGLALTSDHLYWTDWTFRGIMRCNKLTGENVTLVAQTALLPYDLKIHQAASQPSGENPCQPANGHCDQLCLISPLTSTADGTRFRCSCADGFQLASDNRTCQANCPEEKIACLGENAKCISRIYWCDGTSHCANMEDEQDCPKRICSIGQFQCHDGNGCITPYQLCDGTNDCQDRSDEKYCATN